MAMIPACRVLIVAVLCVSACTQPVPGVLTLAPAGMRISGTATPHPDGTLAMTDGCTAESEVYADAGTVTITITASASVPDRPASVEVWFAGTSIGSQPVPAGTRTAIAFHARSHSSGPFALRLVAHAAGADPGAAAVEVEKVVITEP